MSRRPARVTEADLRRAVKVADQARTPRTVEVTPEGIIRIVPTIPRKDGWSAGGETPRHAVDGLQHSTDGEKDDPFE